jgi:hypothetical protein
VGAAWGRGSERALPVPVAKPGPCGRLARGHIGDSDRRARPAQAGAYPGGHGTVPEAAMPRRRAIMPLPRQVGVRVRATKLPTPELRHRASSLVCRLKLRLARLGKGVFSGWA